MYRLSKFLSSVAIISATLAVSITYYEIPPIGYEGMIFVSSVAVVLAIGSALLSLSLAAIHTARRRSPKPVIATVLSVLSLIVAFGYIWAL